jgi:hypothetical protein
MDESNVKLTIQLVDSDLDEEELDEATRRFAVELRELEEVGNVERVPDKNLPEGAKPLASFLVGLLTAEVNIKNLKSVMGFIGDRLGNKAIEVEAEVNGKKIKIKANSREELKAAMETAKDFFKED